MCQNPSCFNQKARSKDPIPNSYEQTNFRYPIATPQARNIFGFQFELRWPLFTLQLLGNPVRATNPYKVSTKKCSSPKISYSNAQWISMKKRHPSLVLPPKKVEQWKQPSGQAGPYQNRYEGSALPIFARRLPNPRTPTHPNPSAVPSFSAKSGSSGRGCGPDQRRGKALGLEESSKDGTRHVACWLEKWRPWCGVKFVTPAAYLQSRVGSNPDRASYPVVHWYVVSWSCTPVVVSLL